jgi:DNA-binding LacI/PurR family transcriptional regulator
MCPRLTESRCAWLTERLEGYLSELGYALVIAQSYGSRQGEQDALHRLVSQHVDGVIIIPTSRETRKALRAMEQAPEAVFLGAYLGDQPESYVAVDHFLGGQAAVRHLEKHGCKQLLFVGSEDSEASNKRRGGVVSAAKQLRLNCLCMDVKELPQVNWEEFDGIIAADCDIARQLPADKKVVSFDGDTQGDVDITTLDTPDNMARIAAEILLEKLERPIGGYSHRMVVPQLRERKEEVKTYG